MRSSESEEAALPQVALRLAATADDLPQLEQALSEMELNRTERTTVTSTYFDTAAGGLDRVGLALQVQKQNGRYKQIVTTAELKEQPPLTLCEWEDFIDGERPDLGAPNSSVHLPKALNEAELQARFATMVQRAACTLEPDASTEIVGAVDKGSIDLGAEADCVRWRRWTVSHSRRSRKSPYLRVGVRAIV